MPQFGALKPSQAYYQSSGEATPQGKLPDKYVPVAHRTDDISSHLNVPPDWNGNTRRQPIVQRAARTVGMRYLYARGATRMPIQRLGADGVPYPQDSAFQPNNMGPIRNCGFNYALFQAGYPGYNLGLSFKVPTLEQNARTGARGGRTVSGNVSTGPVAVKMNTTLTSKIGRAMGRRGQN